MGIQAFGAFLLQRRREMGLTQEQIVKAAGIDQSYLSRLERGDDAYKSVGVDILKSLASALNSTELELDALLYDRPLPRPVTRTPEIAREIPVVASVSAGPGSGDVVDYVYVGLSEVRGRLLKAVIVQGDCLAPQIPTGSLVIIDVSAAGDVRDGQVVAATLLDSGDHVLKRFYQLGNKVKLEPNIGQPIIVDADRVKIEGVAVEIRQYLNR